MNTIAPPPVPLSKRTVALTVSPPTRVNISKISGLNKDELIERFDKDSRIIQKALNRCSHDYEIYPEFDDKGRLHYHGIVKIHSNVSFKLETIPVLEKQLGYTCIKDNPDDKWTQYMLKDWEETKEILNILSPITYTDLRKVRKFVKPKPVIQRERLPDELLRYLRPQCNYERAVNECPALFAREGDKATPSDGEFVL